MKTSANLLSNLMVYLNQGDIDVVDLIARRDRLAAVAHAAGESTEVEPIRHIVASERRRQRPRDQPRRVELRRSLEPATRRS